MQKQSMPTRGSAREHINTVQPMGQKSLPAACCCKAEGRTGRLMRCVPPRPDTVLRRNMIIRGRVA